MKQAERYDAPVSFMFFVKMKDNGNRLLLKFTLEQAIRARRGSRL
jgi:hypothetical protein